MSFHVRAALAATVVSIATLPPQPSLAADAQAVADALVAALEAASDGTVTLGEARAEGDDVLITDLAFARPDEDGRMVFSRTLIVAPEERSEGGFEAEQIAMSGGTFSGDGSGSIESATIYAATILSADEIAEQELNQGILYETVEISNVTFQLEDQPGEVAIAYIEVNADDIVDNVPQASSGMAEGITVPTSAFGEGPMTPQALGYETLEFEVSWEGGRDPATNELTIEDVTVTMLEGGSLTLSAKIGNVPFASMEDPTGSAAAAGQITVYNVRLHYEDGSLATRLLDAFAKPQGMTGAQYGQQLAAALPFLLAAINNPGFQQQVTNAVGSFLQDPQSLTIEVAPEQPITGAEIMEIVNTAPNTLPDRLNASVSANGAQ
ncbi:MAG TPA: hypothetical protein VHG92_00790 [Afifellaceae bacterium]|nr:hypothetical protein [Afifellaceae bacterium]